MTKQPKALLLANILENQIPSIACLEVAAKELRRLHDVNQELLEALKEMCSYTAELNPNQNFDGFDDCAVNKARAAIGKAEESKHD